MPDHSFMVRLRGALEASWNPETAYEAAAQPGNPALGQRYPASRIVQHYYPETQIIKGTVRTSHSVDIHFWNGLQVGHEWYHLDLSWQQFPGGSIVSGYDVLDRHKLNDSAVTKLIAASHGSCFRFPAVRPETVIPREVASHFATRHLLRLGTDITGITLPADRNRLAASLASEPRRSGASLPVWWTVPQRRSRDS